MTVNSSEKFFFLCALNQLKLIWKCSLENDISITKTTCFLFYFFCYSDDDYDDKPHGEEASLSESVKPYESDDDPTEEYGGDFDVSKFNEDGSFIGLYGDKKSKYSSEAKEATV